MREDTAYLLLSEADALVVGALGALLIEDYFRGAFPDPRLAALLSLFLATAALALLFYMRNRMWYGKFIVKGLGENSRGIYSIISALSVTALTTYCVFVRPSAAAVAGGMALLIMALAVQSAMWLRAVSGMVSVNKLWRSQNRWGAVGWPLVIGVDMLGAGLAGGVIGVAAGALLGWAPLYANVFYSMDRVIEYGNRFSRLFLPALMSFDVSLVFAAFTGWYFNGFNITIEASVLLCVALIVAELALVLAMDRAGVLKAGAKKLDGPTARVQ
jgi:hypothetical protein